MADYLRTDIVCAESVTVGGEHFTSRGLIGLSTVVHGCLCQLLYCLTYTTVCVCV